MGIIGYVKVDKKYFGSRETFVIAISCSASYAAAQVGDHKVNAAYGTDHAIFVLVDNQGR